MTESSPLCLDHISLLVRSLAATRDHLIALGLEAGSIEDFPGEGTRECYFGDTRHSARLLLCEAVDPDSPYGQALAKRGPGLHHVAFKTPVVTDYVDELVGSGWLLLPQSLRTLRDSGTAWLARPGVPFLVEVDASAAGGVHRPPYVSQLEIAGGPRLALRLARLAPAGQTWEGFSTTEGAHHRLSVDGHQLIVKDLCDLDGAPG